MKLTHLVPNQIAFGNWPSRPNQIGPNEIITFGTKPKQMTFGNWLARPNQMRPNESLQFGFKEKPNNFGSKPKLIGM